MFSINPPPTSMHTDTQNKAPGLNPLKLFHEPSLSPGVSQPSSSRVGGSPLTPDTSFSGSSGPSFDVQARLARLTLTSVQENNNSGLDSERARKLKALPACESVIPQGSKAMEHWSQSFDLMDQEFLLPDLEDLNALKKQATTDLIQSQFENLVAFSAGFKSCVEQFQALQRPLDELASGNHTTVAQKVEAVIKLRQEVEKNWRTFRENLSVISSNGFDIWEFQDESVKEARARVQSRLFAEHDKQEDIPSALDMLKDGEHLMSKIKDPWRLATSFAEGFSKSGLLKLSTRHRRKWLQESKMRQDVYKDESSKINALSQKLDESKDSLRNAYSAWGKLPSMVYSDIFVVVRTLVCDGTDADFSLMTVTNVLNEAEGKLLTLVELIDGFLEQIEQEYGLKLGTRQVKRLCSRLPHIVIALEMLLSAKEVVVDVHKDIYEEHIYELCKTILEHLNLMQEVHSECRITASMQRQAAFVRDDVPRFQSEVAPPLDKIKKIAEVHISTSKSKEAYEKRAREDRFHGNSSWAREGRPLVTSEEISWALDKVIDAIVLIGTVSSASTIDYTEETIVNDSPRRIDTPDEMIDHFYMVLLEEAKKLETLKSRRERRAKIGSEEQEREGPVTRFFRSMIRKPH